MTSRCHPAVSPTPPQTRCCWRHSQGVRAGPGRKPVQDRSEHRGTGFGESLLSLANGGPVAPAGIDDQERSIQERAEDRGVGDRNKRRAVEDDEVAGGLEPFESRTHPLRSQQLGRVGRQWTRW